MTTSNSEHERFWELVDAACEGSMSQQQMVELEEILAADQNLQQQYLDHLRIKVDLSYLTRTENACEKVIKHIDDRIIEKELSENSKLSSVLGFLSGSIKQASRRMRQPSSISVSVAFVVLAGAILLMSLVYLDGRNSQLANDNIDESAPVVVASITAMQDCLWVNQDSPRKVGDALYRDETIKLKQGKLQVTFNNSVKILLEAPVSFQLTKKNGGELHSGKLAAYVPWNARGFTVDTLSARLVDLGTKFGVAVEIGETTIVQVTRGRVEVYPKDSEGMLITAQKRTLHAGESLHVAPSGFVKDAGKANFPFPDVDELENLHKYKEWLQYSNQLSKDKDVVAYYTFEKSDQLRNQAASTSGKYNSPLSDATTSPTWSTGRWLAKSALSFESEQKQHLVISDWNSTGIKDAMTMSAWVKLRSNTGYQLVASQWVAPYSYYFGFREKDNEFGGQGIPLSLRLSEDGGEVGIRKSERVNRTVTKVSAGWVHIAFTVAADGGVVRLYKNGREVDTNKKTYKPKQIMNIDRPWVLGGQQGGRVCFDGWIDEFVILKRAMTATEIKQMYDIGKP